MKQVLIFFLGLFLAQVTLHAQAVSINTDGSAPAASAILDVKSSNKGMLVPRMTTAQRTAIAAPATGLLVYDTNTNGFWFYNGSAWTNIGGGASALITDADGNTKVQVEKNPNEDIIRFDLGGTENLVLRKNANGYGRLEFPGNTTFVGKEAGSANSSGTNNTATGAFALAGNTTGNSNVAIGMGALFSSTDRSNLVAVGDSAMYNNGIGASGLVQANFNTALGGKALYANTTGSNNTVTGYQSMVSNTTGSFNTANGVNALVSNTAGGNNTATGANTLYANTTGIANTANGHQSLRFNTTGSFNTATGQQASYSNTTGISNTATGQDALYANTTGNDNTATGRSALTANTTGSNNTANGFEALYKNTEGNLNTADGIQSLYNNTTGNNNTAQGFQALIGNTTGSNNTALGALADVSAVNLTNATAIGYNAKVGASNSLVLGGTGADAVNVGVGTSVPAASAILDLQSGNRGVLVPRMSAAQRLAIVSPANGLLVYDLNFNTFWYYKGSVWTNLSAAPAIVQDADGDTKVQVEESPNENIIRFDLGGTESMVLRKNAGSSPRLEFPDGLNNTFVGTGAGFSITTGGENAATGALALFSNTTGNYNVASGYQALFNTTTAHFNTAVGRTALFSTTTGGNNIGMGYNALAGNITGSNNTALGTTADVTATNLTNATAVGYAASVNASNKVRIGNASVTVIEGQVDWTFPSDARFKFNVHDDQVPGLALIEKLRPVTYQFDTRKFDEHLMQNMPDSTRRRRMAAQDYRESSARVQTGFLAQEVEKACQDLNFDFSGLHVPTNASDNYGISYGSFVPLLVKAVQEQQAMLDIQTAEIKTQQTRIDAQQAEIEQLKRRDAEHAALKAQLEKITAALQQAGISLN